MAERETEREREERTTHGESKFVVVSGSRYRKVAAVGRGWKENLEQNRRWEEIG